MATDTRRPIGIKGEEEAARFLSRCGYAILDKNVRTRVGEIDLVAKEGKTLVFVEVKTRKEIADEAQPKASRGLSQWFEAQPKASRGLSQWFEAQPKASRVLSKWFAV